MKITHTVDTVKEEYYGVTLEIARSNNQAFQAKFRKLTKPYRRQIDNKTISDEKSVDLVCEAMAGTVLVGWSGTFPDGQQYEYSEDAAKQLLVDDQDAREFVSNIAGDLSLFLDEIHSEVKKTQ